MARVEINSKLIPSNEAVNEAVRTGEIFDSRRKGNTKAWENNRPPYPPSYSQVVKERLACPTPCPHIKYECPLYTRIVSGLETTGLI